MHRTARRSFAAAVCSAALAVSLAGCGGDDKDDSAPKPLTKEEFITQADKICSDGDDEIAALEPAADASAEEQDQAVRDVGGLLREQAADIRKLTPPADIADDVDAMLDSLEAGADVIKDKGAEAISIEPNVLADAAAKADALGFKSCGN